jgi:Ca-activated chloride channel family protein
LVEVEIDAAKPRTSREIACAEVRYENASDARPVSQSARAMVSFSAARAEVVSSANHQVQADYAANRIAETRDEVVVLIDAGRRDEAVTRLREVGSSLDKLGRDYSNSAVLSVAAPAASAAAKVEAGGLSSADRKDYRAKAQQTYNQQRAE